MPDERPHSAGYVDLSIHPEVTTALLARPLDWRVRVVEHLDVDTSSSCVRRRSLQVAPLRPLLPPGLAEDADHALVILNLASVPRGALVDLDISGPDDSPAFLLPRRELCRREADYLTGLASDAGLPVSAGLARLLAAALGHTKTAWSLDGGDNSGKVQDYLEDGFATRIPDQTVAQWHDLDQRIAELLAPHADTNDSFSSCEHPIVALPDLADLVDIASPTWADELSGTLEDYLTLLEQATAMAEQHGPSAAGDLLASWADYGRNYDMLVATTVPLDQPFLLKYSERRQLDIDASGRAAQDLVLSDAISNHVVLSIFDASVVMTEVTADIAGQPAPAYGALAVRHTDQTYAIYAHDEDRSYRITLRFSLAPRRQLQVATYGAAALLVLISIGVAYEHPHRLQDLALIVGPSALAISLLTVREPTTLSARLRRRSSRFLTLAVVLLVVCATLSYLWPAVQALTSIFFK